MIAVQWSKQIPIHTYAVPWLAVKVNLASIKHESINRCEAMDGKAFIYQCINKYCKVACWQDQVYCGKCGRIKIIQSKSQCMSTSVFPSI